jgi:DNA-directed RNA polymerase specialized sigma24 family protein
MRRLSAAQRLTLSLCATGYSYKEISAATGKTYTWVNRHLTEGTAKPQQLTTQDE